MFDKALEANRNSFFFFVAAVLGEEAQRSERLRHRRGAGENNGAAERPSGCLTLICRTSSMKLERIVWTVGFSSSSFLCCLRPSGVGPGCTDKTLLSAIASALHTSAAPITGQLSAAVEKNPGVWLNTAQPLCKAFIVTDEDIRWAVTEHLLTPTGT